MRCTAFLLLGVFACASTPSAPAFHDEKYLRFGVDPKEEAEAVIESQKSRDYVVALQINGQHFTALGFMDKQGRSTAVRLLTVRGTVIALDSRPEGQTKPPVTYALLAPPISNTYDADRDGFDEVFVEERAPGKTCVQIYRVRDVGFVDPVVVDTRVFGQDVCPRAAVDLDSDGTVELVTELDFLGFPRAGQNVQPRHILLPLWASQHRFVARAGTPAQRTWLKQERTRHEAELQDARARLDVSNCYMLGIELAALAYLNGADRDGQLAAFDAALNGLVLQPAQAAANLRARAHIYTDWNKPDPEPQPAPTPAREGARAAKTPSDQASATPLSAAARARETKRANAPAGYDGPPLAEGDLVITPESAAAGAAPKHRAIDQAPIKAAQTSPPSPLTAAEVVAYRNTARELGNAAVAARQRAAEARRASAEERRAAQAARVQAAETKDPAAAGELRKAVAEHTSLAQRYAAEALEHAAEAAKQRAALEAHRATAPAILAAPPQ